MFAEWCVGQGLYILPTDCPLAGVLFGPIGGVPRMGLARQESRLRFARDCVNLVYVVSLQVAENLS